MVLHACIRGAFTKTEVGELEHALVDENILGFEISEWPFCLPVNDAFLDELDETVADLSEHLDRLGLWYSLTFVHDTLQVSAIAELLDDVIVVVAFHHFQEAHDIRRLQ